MRIIKTPKTKTELNDRIQEFIKEYEPSPTKPLSPRLLRINIGVSKQTLSYWKTSTKKRPLFDLIKTYEDILLAYIEQATIDLSRTDSETRVNILGLFNTLRAYDAEQYVPELRDKEVIEHQEPIRIEFENKSKMKLITKKE